MPHLRTLEQAAVVGELAKERRGLPTAGRAQLAVDDQHAGDSLEVRDARLGEREGDQLRPLRIGRRQASPDPSAPLRTGERTGSGLLLDRELRDVRNADTLPGGRIAVGVDGDHVIARHQVERARDHAGRRPAIHRDARADHARDLELCARCGAGRGDRCDDQILGFARDCIGGEIEAEHGEPRRDPGRVVAGEPLVRTRGVEREGACRGGAMTLREQPGKLECGELLATAVCLARCVCAARGGQDARCGLVDGRRLGWEGRGVELEPGHPGNVARPVVDHRHRDRMLRQRRARGAQNQQCYDGVGVHRDDRTARYRILRRLGQGGMAEVFEAELAGDHGFVRKVAIKRMLEAAAADGVAARRFLDEAVIASRLHHANVVAVVDLGLLDDRPFQVLEYVDGLDTQELLARAGGSLPIEVALVIATAVAHALDHAHTACDASGLPLGIVHRDVKPSNVLVSSTGDVKLGDFGIAVARDRESRTEAGMIAGTAGFIAPEQRSKQPLDGRTDVFALGLTLHALLTGDSPLADLEVDLRVVAGGAVPIDPRIAADVRAILVRALAVDRLVRPTAGQLAAELAAVLAPRLQGDGRAVVRDFVARLAPKPAARVGALDALLGIEVVEVAEPNEAVHRFETRTARREPTAATVPLRVAAPRRRAPLAIALIGVALGGLAIYGLSRTSSPILPDAAQVVALDAAAPDERPSLLDAVEPPVIDSSVVIADGRRAVVVTRDAGTRARDASISVAPPPDASLGIGYLQVLGAIAGEDVIGASVIVDGKTLGSIPNVFAVPLGAHRVEVERRNGTRLPAITVELTPVHNRANPLRPSW